MEETNVLCEKCLYRPECFTFFENRTECDDYKWCGRKQADTLTIFNAFDIAERFHSF